MKSVLSGEKVMANPATVEAKLKIAEAEAGAAGGGLIRCFPRATKQVKEKNREACVA